MRPPRAVAPDPFIRGQAWPGTPKVPYPRAKPSDAFRLPVDPWTQARIPVGGRLELVGDAEKVEISTRRRERTPASEVRPGSPSRSGATARPSTRRRPNI